VLDDVGTTSPKRGSAQPRDRSAVLIGPPAPGKDKFHGCVNCHGAFAGSADLDFQLTNAYPRSSLLSAVHGRRRGGSEWLNELKFEGWPRTRLCENRVRCDSPLEGDGFEPSVPRRERSEAFRERQPSWRRQKSAAPLRGREIRMLVGTDPFATAKPDRRLIKLLIRARRFNAALAGSDGVPFAALAKQEGVSPSYFTRLVRLSYLAPDITEAILDGRHPPDLTADKLLAHSRLPLGWHEQRTVLGFA
jgi:hypothetical protein